MVIEPDTKDWTWVLGRRCPECGYDATTFRAVDVADGVRTAAATWTTVLGRSDARQRPSARQWSALEYGCHVRDVCDVFYRRLDLMLTTEDPVFTNWDQDATAVERHYDEQDPAAVSGELTSNSSALADRLATVEGTQWSRPGRRSDGAAFTIETFARYLLHDLVHHLWDVGEQK